MANSMNEDLMASIQRFHDSVVQADAEAAEIERLNARRSPLFHVKQQLVQEAIQSEILQYAKDIETGWAILVREFLQTGDESFSGARLIPKEKIAELRQSGRLVQWIRDGVPLYKLLELSPEAVYKIYALVVNMVNSEVDRKSEALSLVRLLLTLVPYVADFWALYGLCLFQNKLLEHGVAACEQALRLDPRCYDASLLLIRLLKDLGRTGEADARLGSCLEDAQRRSDSEAIALFSYARYHIGAA